MANTPHTVFEDENAEVIVEQVVYKNSGEESKEAVKGSVATDLSEDVSMDDNEGFQCSYCGEYHEDWIACDNKACTFQWYGLECVGLTEAPAGKWLCALCRPRPVFPNLAGAPNVGVLGTSQQNSKGVATKKVNHNKLKPGWKGWVEVPDGMMEMMEQQAEAKWEIVAVPKRTRTKTDIHESKQKPRQRRQKEGNSQSSQPAKYQGPKRTSTPEERESRYDSESTFEGFSDPELAESVESGLEGVSVVDEDEEEIDLSSGDQSANEVTDADKDQGSEIADDFESSLEALSVVDEDEAGELPPGDQLGDEGSDVDDDQEAEPRDSQMETIPEEDVGIGALRETRGFGAMDYEYLDLSSYGPYLVRRA